MCTFAARKGEDVEIVIEIRRERCLEKIEDERG
jgi:hypothetical protein